MAKHTPGPWRALNFGGTYALCGQNPALQEPEEIDANEALISAAPELYKACLRAIEFICASEEGTADGINLQSLTEALMGACKLAEGE